MSTTSSLAASLLLFMVCMNAGAYMVTNSGYQDVSFGLTGQVEQSEQDINGTSTDAIGIASTFLGAVLTVGGLFLDLLVMLIAGMPLMIMNMGAPSWVYVPIGTVMVFVEGLAFMAVISGSEV